MQSMRWMSAGMLVALLMSGGVAFADGSSPPPPAESASAQGDRDFLVSALRVNQLELTLGKMAVERANTPAVKVMGTTMVQKHTELGGQLGAQAKRLGAPLAPPLLPDQQSTVDRLASMSAAHFDDEFKETVDAGHVLELAMYRVEASQTADAGLRTLAQRRVATLEKSVAQAAQAAKAKPADGDDW
jgi:putative membrane protein